MDRTKSTKTSYRIIVIFLVSIVAAMILIVATVFNFVDIIGVNNNYINKLIFIGNTRIVLMITVHKNKNSISFKKNHLH